MCMIDLTDSCVKTTKNNAHGEMNTGNMCEFVFKREAACDECIL